MQANHAVKHKITTYDIVVTALFAAICYVATNFRIEIPTPLGKTMIHCGNVFCLLSAMLMGGLRGGIADATGLGLFDLLGGWASSAPSTFIMRFIMGLVGGSVASVGNHNETKPTKWTILGAVTGMVTYVILYLGYSFLKGIVLGNAVGTVLTDVAAKAATSIPSGCVSIVVAVILYPFFRKALTAAGYYQKRA